MSLVRYRYPLLICYYLLHVEPLADLVYVPAFVDALL